MDKHTEPRRVLRKAHPAIRDANDVHGNDVGQAEHLRQPVSQRVQSGNVDHGDCHSVRLHHGVWQCTDQFGAEYHPRTTEYVDAHRPDTGQKQPRHTLDLAILCDKHGRSRDCFAGVIV